MCTAVAVSGLLPPITCADLGCGSQVGVNCGESLAKQAKITVSGTADCASTIKGGTTSGFAVNDKSIKQGTYSVFDVVFQIDSAAAAGGHLCQLKVKDYSKDFVIQVKT